MKSRSSEYRVRHSYGNCIKFNTFGSSRAASYAAYATVYAYGGYAVNNPQSFEAVFAWQVEGFRELAGLDTSATAVSA